MEFSYSYYNDISKTKGKGSLTLEGVTFEAELRLAESKKGVYLELINMDIGMGKAKIDFSRGLIQIFQFFFNVSKIIIIKIQKNQHQHHITI
jgi:hypothetical protein